MCVCCAQSTDPDNPRIVWICTLHITYILCCNLLMGTTKTQEYCYTQTQTQPCNMALPPVPYGSVLWTYLVELGYKLSNVRLGHLAAAGMKHVQLQNFQPHHMHTCACRSSAGTRDALLHCVYCALSTLVGRADQGAPEKTQAKSSAGTA